MNTNERVFGKTYKKIFRKICRVLRIRYTVMASEFECLEHCLQVVGDDKVTLDLDKDLDMRGFCIVPPNFNVLWGLGRITYNYEDGDI